MGKYLMVVQSQPKQGRDDEYNAWYDGTHYGDICAIPGVKSGRRFERAMAPIGPQGLSYLATFEIEADDPASIMAEMGKRSADGTMKTGDALDAGATVLWFYKLREQGS